MKLSAKRIGLLGILSILSFALALAGLEGVAAQTTPTTVDYDTDDDRLIDITALAQLNAMRYDLRGSGEPSDADSANHAAAFPNAVSDMGCPAPGCKGYELLNDLTFDANDDDVVDANDPYPNWTPIGDGDSPFRATFDGKGHVISHLKVSGEPEEAGLFGALRGATVSDLGLLEVDVSSTQDDSNSAAGALAGAMTGSVSNVYATGKVSGESQHIGGLIGIASGGALIKSSWANVSVSSIEDGARVGGLVGNVKASSVFASCAFGDVSSSGPSSAVGGLFGLAKGASVEIRASCARGDVSAAGTRAAAGGFLGKNGATALTIAASYSTGKASGATSGAFIGSGTATVSDSYWDATTSAIADDSDTTSPEGKTTAQLQTPTAATGIYANWDDLDLTDDETANAVDDPWDFGTSSQYPAISFGSISASAHRETDYDGDDDGFIDITNLTQLNAVRYDLDGDGKMPTNATNYSAAFPDAASDMGCPSAGCDGYEVRNDLTFDTDGDGDVDADDTYPNWTPIGDEDNPFAGGFKGNVNAIAKMKINAAAARVGLFGEISSTGSVKGVRLVDVDLTSTAATASVGALAGENGGTVSSSSAAGTVSSTGTTATNVGGLIGKSLGKIYASWARVSVSAADPGGNVGGLVGEVDSGGVLTAVHALGPVSTSGARANIGGLIGKISGSGSSVSASFAAGKVAASESDANKGGLAGSCTTTSFSNSYWDADTTKIPATTVTNCGSGKTTAELRTPTAATGIYRGWGYLDLTNDGVANRVDRPWDFGTTTHYPVLTWGGQKADDQYDGHDADGDGLIEITSLAQLNAMRYDLDGNGSPTTEPTSLAAYAAAFPNARADMGCPSAGCEGYELQNDLTFDTNNDENVDSNDSYPNWTPIGNGGAPFSATFDGNGKTISKMKINGSHAPAGLFGAVSGIVKGVGLLDADVDVSPSSAPGSAGALVGVNNGTITASYATGKVSAAMNSVGGFAGSNYGWIAACWADVSVASSGTRSRTGGFIGVNAGTTIASYSRGDVSALTNRAGGFAGVAGRNVGSNITASYSTGKVSNERGEAGGLVPYIWSRPGVDLDFVVNYSYWDTDASGIPDDTRHSTRGQGETTAELQALTSPYAIFVDWDDLDLTNDGVSNPVDDPWDFGGSKQYPVLIWGGLRAEDQRDDHDLDDDGLIEITDLRHLDAMRFDLNGDGRADTAAGYPHYAAAFPRAASGMGCPVLGCKGYELAANLTFDADGDGNVDSDDTPYHNWNPIGDAANAFAATFDGNGKTISNLKITGGAGDVGLFGAISSTGEVKGVGLLEVSITAANGARVGALAGDSAGTITSSYAKGAASSTSTTGGASAVGGLVGVNSGMIGASWAGVNVSSAGFQDSVGGLAGINYGKIFAAYATGGVTSTGARSVAGGLIGGSVSASADIKSSYATGAASATGTGSTAAAFVGWGNGQIADSYWDTATSGASDDADSASPEGKTTTELQTPTSATGIYANWDDMDLTNDNASNAVNDPWDFGTSSQYPVLHYGDLKAASQRP